MQSNEKKKYFEELSLNLRREGFTVGPESDGLLPVSLDGQHLCTAPERGGVRYKKEDVVTEAQTAALDKVIDITKTTAEYMRQIEAAPILKASDLSEKFKLLADFNGTVLAGQETKYGVQMVTWDWSYDRTGVSHGHYYGPGGADSYTAAKQNFVVRSGLIPSDALFTPEQLTEVYRSIPSYGKQCPSMRITILFFPMDSAGKFPSVITIMSLCPISQSTFNHAGGKICGIPFITYVPLLSICCVFTPHLAFL